MRAHPFLITLLLSAFSFVAAAESPPRLRIGAVLGLTGPAAAHAGAILGGIRLAIEDLRTRGWTIDLDVQDDQTAAAKTIASVQYLVTNGFRFIIGPTWSFQVKAARPTLERSDALALVPGGSSDVVGGPSVAILNLCAERAEAAAPVTTWLTDKGFKKAFILTSNGDWGETHRSLFSRAVKDAKIQNVGEEQFDFGVDQVFFNSIFKRSKLQDIDVVLTTGTAGDVANIIRTRNAFKLNFEILTTDHVRDTLRMGLLLPADVSRVWLVGLPVGSDWAKRFLERYPDLPTLYSDRAYDAVIMLSKAVQATDGSVGAVRRYLTEKLDYSGAAGTVHFNALGNNTATGYRVIDVADAGTRAKPQTHVTP